MEEVINTVEKQSVASNDSSSNVGEQSQLSMPPPARKSVPPPAPRFDAPKVNPGKSTASGSSGTPIASPPSQAAAANGTDQHFRPPPPRFQSREAPASIAVKTANGQASDTSAAPAPRSSVGALPCYYPAFEQESKKRRASEHMLSGHCAHLSHPSTRDNTECMLGR